MSTQIFDHPVITERYFFPRRAELDEPFWVDCGDVRLSCHYHHHYPDAETIVFFHGNGEVVSDYIDIYIPAFDNMGFNCLLAEYRGYGMSTGAPGLGAMLGDVDIILKSVKAPMERVILFGRSIGSVFALHGVRLCPNVAGLIIESGIADMMERLLLRVTPEEIGTTREMLAEAVDTHFNHQKKLADYKNPTLIMHARGDSMIHYSHAEKLYKWASEPKRLKIFDRGDHNDVLLVNIEEYFQEVYRFLTRL